jgi:hypothetical protein
MLFLFKDCNDEQYREIQPCKKQSSVFKELGIPKNKGAYRLDEALDRCVVLKK